MSTVVIITVLIALSFDFLNGMNDAANSIATVVSTKVLPPLLAVIWAAFFNFAAFFIFGVHVATTIGTGIVDPSIINEYIVLGGLLGAVLWVYLCTAFGFPISVSHAIIGGLIGPSLIAGGTKVIIASGLIKVLLFIFLSPLIGVVLGYIFMIIIMYLFRKQPPRNVDNIFKRLQLLSSAVFSLGHGSNDAQKTIGMISVLLYSTGFLGPEFYVPFWVAISCYIVIALGTLAGGWRVIKTLGLGLTHLKPVHGFCAEVSGALSIIGSTLAGIPVSTTHTITGAIMGVGMTKRLSAVRWGVAFNIVMAWILTIPGTILAGGLFYLLLLAILQ